MVWPDGRGGVWATVKRLLAARLGNRLAPTLSESPQSHSLGEYRQRHAHAEGRALIAAGPGSYIPSTILNYPHGVPRRRIGAQRLLRNLADLAHFPPSALRSGARHARFQFEAYPFKPIRSCPWHPVSTP